MTQLLAPDEIAATRPSERARDFLLLTVFVLAQQGFVERAGVLLEALHLVSTPHADILFGRAVLRFFNRDPAAALAVLDDLDRLDPIERFGRYRLTDRQRMRRFLRAKCLHDLNDIEKAREALHVYLRHGAGAGGSDSGE